MPSPKLKDSEKKNTLNSKAVQFTPSIFSKSAQTQLQKTKHKSVNTVIRQKSIGIQTCLPCQHEVKGAVKDTVEELVLNVENQFIDDAFHRESVNTSKSEYETEYDTEYEPDSSFQLDQSTCLSDDQFSEQEHLEEHLPSNNSGFIAILFILPCQSACQQCVYTRICFSCRTYLRRWPYITLEIATRTSNSMKGILY